MSNYIFYIKEVRCDVCKKTTYTFADDVSIYRLL